MLRSTLSACLYILVLAWPSQSLAWKLEAGTLNLVNTFSIPTATTLTFQQSYPSPPIVIVIPTNQGGDPSDVRIYNVTNNSAQVMQVEPSTNDGPHVGMNAHYIVVERGTHVFPDGRLIHASSVDTLAVQHGATAAAGGAESWVNQTFPVAFPTTPAVLGNIQTINNEVGEAGTLPPSRSSVPWMSIAVNAVSLSSADFAIERSEDVTGTISSSETIGYIAIEPTNSGSFVDNGGSSIRYEAFTTANIIRGFTDTCTTVAFTGSYANRIAVATKNTRVDNDGGWIRRCALANGSFGLELDEDRDLDNERAKTAAEAEKAGIAVFSNTFNADFDESLSIRKSVKTIKDPVNNTTNPKAIPGAHVEYTIDVANNGFSYSDDSSTVVIDPIPGGTRLCLSTICNNGAAPFSFTDGAANSNLSFSYINPTDASDSVSFSNDGGATFMYTPVVDVDGTDANITHIQFASNGLFAADESTNPNFSLTFNVVVE